MKFGVVMVAALAAFWTGCSTELSEQERIDQEMEEIIGGRRDRNNRAVVGIVGRDSYGRESHCTGIVVSPRVVLTAAHCIADSSFAYLVTRSSNLRDIDDDEVFEIEGALVDPRFRLGQYPLDGYDWGAIVLKRRTGIRPVALNCNPLDASVVGAPATVVGYGVRDPRNGGSSGLKMSKGLTIDYVDGLHLYINDDSGTACGGDSGGPLLQVRDGKIRVVGINTAADAECKHLWSGRADLYSWSVQWVIDRYDPGYKACN